MRCLSVTNKALLVAKQRCAYDATVAQAAKKSPPPRNARELVLTAANVETPRMNRRRCIRYPLRALAIFQWNSSEGTPRRVKGWTKDVSEAGAYVVSSQCPKEGELIRLILKLPVRRAGSADCGIEIDMEGSVLRVDRDAAYGRELGFALRKSEAVLNSERHERFETATRTGEEPVLRRLGTLRTN